MAAYHGSDFKKCPAAKRVSIAARPMQAGSYINGRKQYLHKVFCSCFLENALIAGLAERSGTRNPRSSFAQAASQSSPISAWSCNLTRSPSRCGIETKAFKKSLDAKISLAEQSIQRILF